jgi:hypothetical protein
MPTKTSTSTFSSLLARSDTGLNLGGGKDTHLSMVANPAGYQLRGLVGFSLPGSWWSDVRKLTKAELLLTGVSGTAHVGRGGSPQAAVRRITGGWSPNTAGESWTTAPVVYPGPSITTAGGVTANLPTGSSQVAIDVTSIVLAWAPSSVVGPGGVLGGGAGQYGIALYEIGGTANAAEVYSAAHGTSSARPILRLTYESNGPPTAPTLIRPLGPDQAADAFEGQTSDPESDALLAYDIQCSTDPDFGTVTHWDVAGGTSGITGYHIGRAYGGVPLTTDARYYWRMRARDVGSGTYGPWSSVATFVKGAGVVAPDAYDLWAAAILEDMAAGRRALRLGTIRPRGLEVERLVCADFGDLFTVAYDETPPPVSAGVYMLGQTVSLGPDGWAVDAVVELVGG